MPDALDPSNLRRIAREAVHQAGLRLHEIPAKDLPDAATTLLHLADYMESAQAAEALKQTEATEVPTAPPKPDPKSKKP